MIFTCVPAGVMPWAAGSPAAYANMAMICATFHFGVGLDIPQNQELYNIGVGRPRLSEEGGEYYPASRTRRLETGRVVGDDEYLQPVKGPRKWRRR